MAWPIYMDPDDEWAQETYYENDEELEHYEISTSTSLELSKNKEELEKQIKLCKKLCTGTLHLGHTDECPFNKRFKNN